MARPAHAYLPGNRRTAGEVLGSSVFLPGCGSLAGWLHCPCVEPPAGAQRCARPGALAAIPHAADWAANRRAQRQRAHSHLRRMAWALAASCHSSLQSFRRLCACRRYNPQAEGVRAYLRHKQGVQVRVGGSSLVLFRAAALRLPSARSPTAVCISSTALSTARGDADRPMPSCAAGRGFVDPAVPDGPRGRRWTLHAQCGVCSSPATAHR